MGSGHVGTLAIRVRTPGGTEASRDDVDRAVQALTRRALGRAVDRLDADGPTRIVFLRRLELRWRLPDDLLFGVLADEPEVDPIVDRLASDIADALRPAWVGAPDAPNPDDDVVVFADEARWWADALLSRADGRRAWYHQRLWEGFDTRASGDAEPATTSPWSSSAVVGERGADPRDPIERLATDRADLGPAVLIALGDAVERVLRASPVHAVAQWADVLTRSDPVAERAAATSRRSAEPVEVVVAIARRLAPERAAPSGSRRVRTSARSEDPATVEPVEPVVTLGATGFAGLFYLAPLVLELGIAERLWAACLAEGRLLGWAAAPLVGDDPVAAWFGGEPVRPPPPLSDAQADEVVGPLLGELAAAVGRRRDAVLPVLDLVWERGGLVAALADSVFAVHRAEATGPEQTRRAWATIRAAWPGPIAVDPALVRVIPPDDHTIVRTPRTRTWFTVAGGDAAGPAAARIAALALGACCALFEARTGEPPGPDAATFAARWLAVPAVAETHPDGLVLQIAADRVDFDVRRAGLDRDPGFLPWLGRSVRFRFAGGEPDTLGGPG